MTGFGHQRPRAAHQKSMTTPPVAPESGEPTEVPEPQFVALMRRLGMGSLTFDVPRMGQQGFVSVSEFLDELDRWILSRVDALIEPRLVEQVEAQVAERIEAAIEAAVAERTPQIIEDAFQRVRNDLTGAPSGPLADDNDDCDCDDCDLHAHEDAEESTPQQSRFAAAAEGLVRVSFWSNVEERIVVRYVESLDAELVEWNEDCADPNEDAPLWSADVLIAFGPDVSDERLAVLTKWAHDLLMEDVVAYAGPSNFTTPRLTAEGQDVTAHDGIEEILDMAASETRPRESILPPAETGPAGPGSPGFEPVMVAFWNEDQQRHISDVYESLDVADERFQYGEITLADADRLVHFGDVSTKDLLALTEWAEGLIEEVTVGISGMPVDDDPRFIDGIPGVIDYMIERTGDPASNFTPPTLPSTQSTGHATDGLIAALAGAAEPDTTPVPRDGIFGDMASVMSELGMPEDMIDALLSEEKKGLDLFAEMAGLRTPGTPGRVHDDTPLEGDLFAIDPAALTAALLTLRLNATVTTNGDDVQVVFTDFDRSFNVQAAGNKTAIVSQQTGVRDFSETVNAGPVTHDTIASALWSVVGNEEGAFEHDGPFPPLPAYTPIEAGPLSTEPFMVIMTDPGDWPYNNAYVSSDASILHRIENDHSMPRDEVLQEVVDDMTSIIKDASSEADWWRKVNESIDALGIPEERRFEGIFY